MEVDRLTFMDHHPKIGVKRSPVMHKTIDAIYENGVIKPLERLDISESKKIKITIETTESIVASTKAIIKADPDVVLHVAVSDEYLQDL
jgi:predicted DNA-binding antitoxin AbrB/MazE fold protein